MSNLENGMLVQHASLGLGKIVALEPNAVHVFFATNDARFATKLRLPTALPFLARADRANAWLSGLSDFVLDAKTGRYRMAAAWLSHADAVARFQEVFPGGFADPAYAATGSQARALRWRRAHEIYEEALGAGEGERLLEAGDVAGLTARALKVERQVRPLLSGADKGSFAQALEDRDGAARYFTALLEILSSQEPTEARFEALASAVAAISPGESGWPIATMLPFIARPDVHMLLRPRFACAVAQRLGVELSYEPEPGWATYSSLLRSTSVILERLRPLGARDHVDVETFMHIATTKAAAKSPAPKPQLRIAT